jgi:hypothetical protein
MNVKDFKEWLNKLPEETLDYKVVIRDLKILEDEKIYNRDLIVGYGMIDKSANQLNLFDVDSTKIIHKIRAAASEQKIEGSNVISENVTDETV